MSAFSADRRLVCKNSLASFCSPAPSIIELSKAAEKIYQDSLMVVGSKEAMDKRAMILLYMFIDSKKQFTFAYNISHLTLAIERSVTNPIFHGYLPQSLSENWNIWEEGLKEINKQMVSRVHFAYFFTQFLEKNNLNLPSEEFWKNHVARDFYQDTKALFPFLLVIHRARYTNKPLSLYERRLQAKAFTEWEHAHFIQPKLEDVFFQLNPLFQFALRNSPRRILEIGIVATMKVRTSFNLECYGGSKYFRTEDFMDPDQRINSALKVYRFMENNSFDPSYECYKNSYYTTDFPEKFYEDTEKFVRSYYAISSLDPDSLNLDKDWIYLQYKNLRLNEFNQIPNENIPIDLKDKKNLGINRDPIRRNAYINQAYKQLSQDFSSCFGVSDQIGNWYNFAYWASLITREVIDGSKFKELNIVYKALYKAGENQGRIETQKIKSVVANLNAMDAWSMIPIGKHFVATFCNNKKIPDFSVFDKYFSTDVESERLLRQSFLYYYKSITEKDKKIKFEYISLASTLHVLSEQIRIDRNIKLSFKFNSLTKILKKIYSYRATKFIPYVFGNSSEIIKIDLKRNVPIGDIHSYLIDIKTPDYKKLLKQYGIEQRIDLSRNTYAKTKVKDWSNLRKRSKFLIALFRSYITSPLLSSF